MSFIDNLFSNKKDESKSIGTRIKALRIRQKRTVRELADHCGVSENSYRHWESSIRQISEDKLNLIAEYLDVPVAALRDYSICNYVDVMHILFNLYDSFGIYPSPSMQKSQYALLSKDETLTNALRLWYLKLQEYEHKSISRDDFDEWMMSFPLKCGNDFDNAPVEEPREYLYTDNEKILFLRKSLQDMRLIVNDKCETIVNCIERKDIRLAREELIVLQRTIDTLSKLDIEQYR